MTGNSSRASMTRICVTVVKTVAVSAVTVAVVISVKVYLVLGFRCRVSGSGFRL